MNSCVQTHIGGLIVGTSLNVSWPELCFVSKCTQYLFFLYFDVQF
jgi:hypothetical protein